MTARFPFLLMILLPFSLPLAGCTRFMAFPPEGSGWQVPKAEEMHRSLPADTGQALLVLPHHGPTFAIVYLLEKHGETWSYVDQPMAAVIGRKGFALPGEKREGDEKTPSGIFSLDEAFGYEPAIKTRMMYRQVTSEDVWVDDVASSDYNRRVKKRETGARSFEELKRADNLYHYAVVIGYNRNPVVKRLGSAIFLHVWETSTTPTSGCVAMAEQHLAKILAWLDPTRNPVVVINHPFH